MTFKPGDRVAAYSGGGRSVGVIEKVLNDRRYMFVGDQGTRFAVHAKQLRRLKKRVAREWQIQGRRLKPNELLISSWRAYQPIVSGPELADGETVTVREIKRREG
jgi:hypothetical protein